MERLVLGIEFVLLKKFNPRLVSHISPSSSDGKDLLMGLILIWSYAFCSNGSTDWL